MADKLIEIRNLVKAYQTGDGPFVALQNIHLDIFRGEFLGITGKSGAAATAAELGAAGGRPASSEACLRLPASWKNQFNAVFHVLRLVAPSLRAASRSRMNSRAEATVARCLLVLQ